MPKTSKKTVDNHSYRDQLVNGIYPGYISSAGVVLFKCLRCKQSRQTTGAKQVFANIPGSRFKLTIGKICASCLSSEKK